MQASQLRPLSEFAALYGVKMVVYGPPGTRKTPLIGTAPNPVACISEPGVLSARNLSTPAWLGTTYQRMKEFVDWTVGSNEARLFETFCFDSVSQMAEIILQEELATNRDPRKAYGNLSRKMMDMFSGLYFKQYAHIYLVAKQGQFDEGGMQKLRPYFPGQDLHIKVPHLYDEILHSEYVRGQDGKSYSVLRTRDGIYTTARDRIGNLDEIEPADLTHIINKSMQRR